MSPSKSNGFFRGPHAMFPPNFVHNPASKQTNKWTKWKQNLLAGGITL